MCVNCQEMAIAIQNHPEFKEKVLIAAKTNQVSIKNNFLASCVVTADQPMDGSNKNARRMSESEHHRTPINLKALSKHGTLFFKDASKSNIDMGGFFSRNSAIHRIERENEKNKQKIKQLETEKAELKRKLENKEEPNAKRFK